MFNVWESYSVVRPVSADPCPVRHSENRTYTFCPVLDVIVAIFNTIAVEIVRWFMVILKLKQGSLNKKNVLDDMRYKYNILCLPLGGNCNFFKPNKRVSKRFSDLIRNRLCLFLDLVTVLQGRKEHARKQSQVQWSKMPPRCRLPFWASSQFRKKSSRKNSPN